MIKSRYISVAIFAFSIALLISGCDAIKKAPKVKTKPPLKKLSSTKYPEFTDDLDYKGLENAILQSVLYLKKLPGKREFIFGHDSYDTTHMIRSMEYFLSFIKKKPSENDLKKFIKSNYLVYQSSGSDESGHVVFTGYFEPVLKGSLTKTSEYCFPIYARPDDLVIIDLSLFFSDLKDKKLIGRYTDKTVVPYYARADIVCKKEIDGKAKVIAWVNDRIDLFFLHVQGSGKIQLEPGMTINVHYDTTNGHQYKSIGKLLIEKGKVPKDEISMQRIRSYLLEHPQEVNETLNSNPSYVFFKIEKEGPFGSLDVPLTPGRSIALDRRIFPPSALSFIDTKKPLIDKTGSIKTWMDCKRFVLNHDTGGAIKGPGRADIFWGNGEYARIAAGHMNHAGRLYFLILKTTTPLKT